MSKKTMRNAAIVIVVVFAITVIVYPLIFGSNQAQDGEPKVELEVGK